MRRKIATGLTALVLMTACDSKPFEEPLIVPPSRFQQSSINHLILKHLEGSRAEFYGVNLQDGYAHSIAKDDDEREYFCRDTFGNFAVLTETNFSTSQRDIIIHDLASETAFDTDDAADELFRLIRADSVFFTASDATQSLRRYRTGGVEVLLDDMQNIAIFDKETPIVSAQDQSGAFTAHKIDAAGELIQIADLGPINGITDIEPESNEDMVFASAYDTAHSIHATRTSTGQDYQFQTATNNPYNIEGVSQDSWKIMISQPNNDDTLWYHDFQTDTTQEIDLMTYSPTGFTDTIIGNDTVLIEMDAAGTRHVVQYDAITDTLSDPLNNFIPTGHTLEEALIGPRRAGNALVEIETTDGTNSLTQALYFNGTSISNPFGAYDDVTWMETAKNDKYCFIKANDGVADDYYLFDVETGTKTRIIPPGQVVAEKFSDDGNLLAYVTDVSGSSVLNLYDCTTGQNHTYLAYANSLRIRGFTKEQEPRVVVASNDNPGELWLVNKSGNAWFVVEEQD